MKFIEELKAIKENNQKIVKRFQFDLEMGFFHESIISISKPNTKYFFYRYFDHNYKKIITVLEEMGYTHSKEKIKIYNEPEGICVCTNDKTYHKCFYSFHWFPNRNDVNIVPEYILDYARFPVLKLIESRVERWIKSK